MKKFILGFFAVVFPFVVFLILDLPGAALIALGLQSTFFGWPVAIIWAFKEINKVLEEDKLKQAAASAAAAAEAAAKAKIDAEERYRAEAEAKYKAEAEMRAQAEAKVRAEIEAKMRAEAEEKSRS